MAKKKKERKIPEVIVFTDSNREKGDLGVFLALSYLLDRKLISLKIVISELGTYEIRRRRAIYAKGVMHHLGYPYMRTAPGGDYEIKNEEADNQYGVDAMTTVFEQIGVAIHRNGTLFLQEYIKSVKDKNILALFNSTCAHFAKYLKATQGVLEKKFKKLIVSGSVSDEKNEEGFYLPDPAYPDFVNTLPAVQTIFEHAQAHGVRLVVFPPAENLDISLSAEVLALLEKSKNPVAAELFALYQDKPAFQKFCRSVITTLTLADGVFKSGGGVYEKENEESNVFFARVDHIEAMSEKFNEILKEKFSPKKITLAQLTRTKEEDQNASNSQ